MIRDGYGQIVYETLPHILLSNASFVTKSCIARFVEGNAFNPSALSDCSTGPSPHWRTQSRPCRHPGPAPAVYSPAYLAAFARFANKRLIVVEKFERNVKYHLSMSSKLGFRVPRWKRNDTFLRAFVKKIAVFSSHMASAVGNVARDSTTMDFRPREALFFGDNFFRFGPIGSKFSHLTFQPKRRFLSIWSVNKNR